MEVEILEKMVGRDWDGGEGEGRGEEGGGAEGIGGEKGGEKPYN